MNAHLAREITGGLVATSIALALAAFAFALAARWRSGRTFLLAWRVIISTAVAAILLANLALVAEAVAGLR